ncbi:hypothetical protein PV325_003581 [Microctonus aethiopoides]|uniref:DUF4780 domain-containing protein n=1 Tax=Microctonus aethiopoides TaxID=144406 RepID=A0AA39FW05_9HYME|nr:hypothetical protein PV325_003581 [Microctonus aethiopoides]KAK0088539.1 hypothetical protein PV326_004806 [Microctonus aethiopoides]KAK0176895.1 hypothetical protein PV328_000993 [Microctonus aethiopoides]
MDHKGTNKSTGDGAPEGVPDPQPKTPDVDVLLTPGQTLRSDQSEATVPLDIAARSDGSDLVELPNPKDSGKRRNRCGSVKKRARKAKAKRELQLVPPAEAISDVEAPQPGGSLVGSYDCGSGTGSKGGPASMNLKWRRNETVTPPEIRKQVKRNKGTQPSSFREALLADRRLAIVPVSYPGRSLRQEAGELLTRALFGAIDAISKEVAVPRFEENWWERGIFWVTYTDDTAKE